MRRKCSFSPTVLFNFGGPSVHFGATYSYGDKGRMFSKIDNLKAAYSAVCQDLKLPARTHEQSVQTAKLLYELADCALRCEVELSMQTVEDEIMVTEECSESMSLGYG